MKNRQNLELLAVVLKDKVCRLDGGVNHCTKEQDLAFARCLTDESLVGWIDALKEELTMTPEQRAKEHEEFIEALCDAEWEEFMAEREAERERREAEAMHWWNDPTRR